MDLLDCAAVQWCVPGPNRGLGRGLVGLILLFSTVPQVPLLIGPKVYASIDQQLAVEQEA